MRAKALEASNAPQTRWLHALALAQDGRPHAAADEVAAWKVRASDTIMQWPRGIFEGLEAMTPGPVGPVLGAFGSDMEAAIVSDDSSRNLEAFDRLEAGLRALPEDR